MKPSRSDEVLDADEQERIVELFRSDIGEEEIFKLANAWGEKHHLYVTWKYVEAKNSATVPSAISKLSPLPPEPYDRGATIDILLNSSKDVKGREKEL
ncbi:hypothetical protein K1719_011694 [Acacia pycnantha]|nr:hypothetical protein K1719_011694 [Acacia pycnantha]